MLEQSIPWYITGRHPPLDYELSPFGWAQEKQDKERKRNHIQCSFEYIFNALEGEHPRRFLYVYNIYWPPLPCVFILESWTKLASNSLTSSILSIKTHTEVRIIRLSSEGTLLNKSRFSTTFPFSDASSLKIPLICLIQWLSVKRVQILIWF